MDISLTPERTLDYGVAYSIVNLPEIFETIAEDGVTEFNPDVVNEYWVLMLTEESLVAGCYNVHQVAGPAYEIHAFMIPEFRKKYAALSGVKIYEWCLENLDFQKLNATIPQKYKNVYHFTKGFGFKDEGFDRDSHVKDRKTMGRYKLGITRQEVIDFLGVGNE
jgi:hypothetical protein